MPTAAWTPQQLRNAFPENHCSGYLLHDRDAIFASVATISAAMKIQAVRTAPRSAWQKRLRECVSALLDGAGLGAPQTTAPFDVKWDSRTVPNGTHSITAIATTPPATRRQRRSRSTTGR
jgi:hypothetical protein